MTKAGKEILQGAREAVTIVRLEAENKRLREILRVALLWTSLEYDVSSWREEAELELARGTNDAVLSV